MEGEGLEPKVCFFFTTLMIILKAAKPTKGDGRGGREENEKKRAQDMLQHVLNSRYAFFLLSFFIITILTNI